MKSPDSEKLLNFLRGLDSPDFDQHEISSVVEFAWKIAVSHLRLTHNRVAQILIHDELTVEDLAIDCIANLFRRDESRKFCLLFKAYSDWQPPVSSPSEALFFFQRVVVSAVEQHVSLLLREADPVFSKILDHVNYMIRRDGYKKLSYCGTAYIVEKDTVEITYAPAGYDEIDAMPSELFNFNRRLLSKLIGYITSETSCFPAIHLNALVNRLKKLNIAAFSVNESTGSFSASLDVDELILNVMEQVESKLHQTYVNSGKLNHSESTGFIYALQSIANDLRDGGINPGLYDYFKVHFPEISKEEYQKRYHNMFEYMFKVMKHTIYDLIKNQR